MKVYSKSVYICRSYDQKLSVLFFETHCTLATVNSWVCHLCSHEFLFVIMVLKTWSLLLH